MKHSVILWGGKLTSSLLQLLMEEGVWGCLSGLFLSVVLFVAIVAVFGMVGVVGLLISIVRLLFAPVRLLAKLLRSTLMGRGWLYFVPEPRLRRAAYRELRGFLALRGLPHSRVVVLLLCLLGLIGTVSYRLVGDWILALRDPDYLDFDTDSTAALLMILANVGLVWALSRKGAVSSDEEASLEEHLELGVDVTSGQPYFLREADRGAHQYMVGATDVGKSKALEGWIMQDILDGRGVGVIDPHADLAKDILKHLAWLTLNGYPDLPEQLTDRLVIVDSVDPDWSVGLNPLEIPPGVEPYEVVSAVMDIFIKIWGEELVGPRSQEVMRNTLGVLTRLKLSLVEMEPFLRDQSLRVALLSELDGKTFSEQKLRQYWERFNSFRPSRQEDHMLPILNKVGAFTDVPPIVRMIGQRKSTIDLREIMDEGKVLLISLPKSKLKEINSYLLGAFWVSKIQEVAFSRQELSRERRRRFYLYVDEFQNYATGDFATVLSEARKYGLSLVMAHQDLGQLRPVPELRAAVLGNARNQLYFRVARGDAEILAKEAFSYTGEKVKERRPVPTRSGWDIRTEYKGVAEEWEEYYGYLEHLSKREFWFYQRGDWEVCKLKTLDVPTVGSTSPEVQEVVDRLKETSFRKYALPVSEVEKGLARRAEWLATLGERYEQGGEFWVR